MLAVALVGCGPELSDLDGAFYDGDHRTVHCGVNIDTASDVSLATLDAVLDRAVERDAVIELYGHNPGHTISADVIQYVLDGARARGMAFDTYADFAHGTETTPGVALAFDDTFITAWSGLRPMFQDADARVTFFVSRYHGTSADQRALLAQLAADGHAIEAHSVNHLRAPDYVENFGLDAYLSDEVIPSIEILRDAGYEVTSFAYPFSARTSEIDDAISKYVPVLRTSTFEHSLNEPFCPR